VRDTEPTAPHLYRKQAASKPASDFHVGQFAQQSLLFGIPIMPLRVWLGKTSLTPSLLDGCQSPLQLTGQFLVWNLSQHLIFFPSPRLEFSGISFCQHGLRLATLSENPIVVTPFC
jgi:hypothetical protein